ncbi:hypothetical protein AX16_010285 [Volvariella volvacea WC 439]|nr:hypothetical protein AX16_010285 [Volvariella volvacea WC 439]
MSRMPQPPVNPEQTPSGIALDPQTLERVIPESRRADGSVRKQIRIRPGFTPQEDVKRFRGTRQQQMDANILPKGHIIGWAPPPSSSTSISANGKPMSKSAKKNAKRKEKREEKRAAAEAVPDDWEADEREEETGAKEIVTTNSSTSISPSTGVEAATPSTDKELDSLSSTLKQLDVNSK